MSFTEAEVNRILESLDEEDLQRVIAFIQFLLDTRKKQRRVKYDRRDSKNVPR